MTIEKPVAFFYDFATDKQVEVVPKFDGAAVPAKWQQNVNERQKKWQDMKTARAQVTEYKPKYSVCDPTKLRRKRKSEAPEENVKRSRTEDNEEDKENVGGDCEADLAITKVVHEELVYTEEETQHAF